MEKTLVHCPDCGNKFVSKTSNNVDICPYCGSILAWEN